MIEFIPSRVDGEGGSSLFTGILQTGQTFTVPATATRPLLRTGRPQMLRASAGGRDLGLIAPEERTVINISLVPQDLAARGIHERRDAFRRQRDES